MERDYFRVGTNGRGWECVTIIISASSQGCCLILSGKSAVILRPNRRPVDPQGPSSKRTFLKQWEPKIAGSKPIVSSQNGGVGGRLPELQPPEPIFLELRKLRLSLGLMLGRFLGFFPLTVKCADFHTSHS